MVSSFRRVAILGFLVVILGLTSALITSTTQRSSIRTKWMTTRTALSSTWQEDVDSLLDVDTPCDNRRDLTIGLFQKTGEVLDDVRKAVQDRDVERIAPQSLKYGKALTGLKAFRNQLVNDILPDLLTKQIPTLLREGPSLVQDAIAHPDEIVAQGKGIVKTIQDISRDPNALQATIEELRKEVKNIVKSTPEGLDTPSYSVEMKTDSYEIRRYAGYSVCSTSTAATSSSTSASSNGDKEYDPLASSANFNVLARYIFGDNVEDKKMSMTTPVIMSGGAMEFVLPQGYDAISAPVPKSSAITLRDVPADLVAVREFTGIATEAEIAKQRAMLEDALLGNGIIYDNLSFKVLQYNPPYTLPWLRRNEVSLSVTIPSMSDSGSSSTSSTTATATDDSSINNSGSDGSNNFVSGDASQFFSSPEAGD